MTSRSDTSPSAELPVAGKFVFFYGTMNAAKTAHLLMNHFAAKERNPTSTFLFTYEGSGRSFPADCYDECTNRVSARSGISSEPDFVFGHGTKIADLALPSRALIVIDEAQCLTEEQVRGFNSLFNEW